MQETLSAVEGSKPVIPSGAKEREVEHSLFPAVRESPLIPYHPHPCSTCRTVHGKEPGPG